MVVCGRALSVYNIDVYSKHWQQYAVPEPESQSMFCQRFVVSYYHLSAMNECIWFSVIHSAAHKSIKDRIRTVCYVQCNAMHPIQFVCFGDAICHERERKNTLGAKLHIFIDTEIQFLFIEDAKQLFTDDPEFRKTNLSSHIPISISISDQSRSLRRQLCASCFW